MDFKKMSCGFNVDVLWIIQPASFRHSSLLCSKLNGNHHGKQGSWQARMMRFSSGALFLNSASYFVHFKGHFIHVTNAIPPPPPPPPFRSLKSPT